MKRVIKNLTTLKGGAAGERVAELKRLLGLGTAAYTPTTDYVAHSLADAANDFLVASGADAFTKKTVEETRAILNKVYAAQEEVEAGESETTLDIDCFLSIISADSAGDDFILPDGDVTGQLKKIMMRTGDGEGSVTGTFPDEYTTLTFDNAGEYALLQWDGTQWVALELASMSDLTNAPAFSS